MPNDWNEPARETGTPREEERERVRDELEARLRGAGVKLGGSETDNQIIALANAVEAFEAARMRLGGDSFTNTLDSSRPDDDRFVLPVRRDDESVEQFVQRVNSAAEQLGRQ